jgi:flagella basal body P-ring formation protein FlgA
MKTLPAIVLAMLGAAVPVMSAHGLQAAAVEIELRPEVVLADPEVRLGDVAVLHSADIEAMRRLVDLPLGEAPRFGGEAVLERAALTRWIRSQAGLAPERIVWQGAERGRLRSAAQTLPGARIERTAYVALQQWLGQHSSRFDIDRSGLQHDIAMPAGKLELKARALPQGTRPTARMVVWVDAWVNGRFLRAVPVSFGVTAYGEAWVARAPMAAGALVRPGMLELREVDLAAQPASMAVPAPADGAQASRLRTLQPIKAGEPLGPANARTVSAVARGEQVTLRFNTGAMQLEARAEALQEGALGQTVRVRLGGAAESVRALVVDRGQVEAMP